jgi:Helix-turn-helix domain
MSIRLMNEIWALDLTPSEKLLLLAMADHANDAGTRVYPSIERLVWKTGLGERTVYRTMRILEGDGIVVKEAQGGGRGKTTHYRLVLEKADKQPPFGAQKQRHEDAVCHPETLSPWQGLDNETLPPWQKNPATMAPEPSFEPSLKNNHHDNHQADGRSGCGGEPPGAALEGEEGEAAKAEMATEQGSASTPVTETNYPGLRAIFAAYDARDFPAHELDDENWWNSLTILFPRLSLFDAHATAWIARMLGLVNAYYLEHRDDPTAPPPGKWRAITRTIMFRHYDDWAAQHPAPPTPQASSVAQDSPSSAGETRQEGTDPVRAYGAQNGLKNDRGAQPAPPAAPSPPREIEPCPKCEEAQALCYYHARGAALLARVGLTQTTTGEAVA